MIHQRKKVWPWIFGIGIGVNLIALGFFIFNELHHRPLPDGKQLKEVIANELQFDHQQRAVFTPFVKNHQHQSATIREEIAKAKKAFYQFENPNPNALKTLTTAYGKLDSLNYAHFRDIRGICKGPQVMAFDLLLDKIITSANFGFMGPRPRK